MSQQYRALVEQHKLGIEQHAELRAKYEKLQAESLALREALRSVLMVAEHVCTAGSTACRACAAQKVYDDADAGRPLRALLDWNRKETLRLQRAVVLIESLVEAAMEYRVAVRRHSKSPAILEDTWAAVCAELDRIAALPKREALS